MATFKFTVNVAEQPKIGAALGVDANNGLDVNDVNKVVTLAALQNFVVAADGADIQGILVNTESHTVNGGFGFGTVQCGGRAEAVVGSGEAGTIAIGAEVIADAQSAVGTAQAAPVVKGGTGTMFKWRVIRNITDPGNAATTGDTVLIERV